MSRLIERLTARVAHLPDRVQPRITGRVLRYDGLIVEATGFPASPGSICAVATEGGGEVQAEVIGFAGGRNLLFLDEPRAVIIAGAQVRVVAGGQSIGVGDALLGRVIDAQGAPLDGGPEPETDAHWPLGGRALNHLIRQPVHRPLDVGIRIINAALTVGQGQRVGIIAGSGVGKSVLIEMMTRYTTADVIVVGLIGERAREVGHFVSRVMQGETASRLCMVAVPASSVLSLQGHCTLPRRSSLA